MRYLLDGIETDRLLFQILQPSHFEQWLPFFEEPLSNQFWTGLPKDPRLACQQQFDRTFERYQKNLGGLNAVLNKHTGELIGLCGILVQQIADKRELEIGYNILPNYWKKGFATEAAKKCKETAFKNQWASSLISIIAVNNHPSQRVAQALGMQKERLTFYYGNHVYIYRISSKA